jgi:hypothetical protein
MTLALLVPTMPFSAVASAMDTWGTAGIAELKRTEPNRAGGAPSQCCSKSMASF